MSVVLCSCCGGFEATEPNGLCEYCVSSCISRRLKGLGCKVLEGLHVADNRDKGFPCTFYPDSVVCGYKKCACSRVLGECWKCSHFRRFMREMDREDERFFDEVERLEKEREAWLKQNRRSLK